tara:strand:+ start:23621 stop:24799 length:1179 start_codon:yes stop_codon:yes gene_type:complete
VKYDKIYYFGVGSLHNNESSVDGGKYIRLPLMQEMHKAGLDIRWIGFKRDGQVDNKYLELIGLKAKDWFISCEEYVTDMFDLFVNNEQTSLDINIAEAIIDKNPGILFIELRPNIDKPGYNFVNEFRVQLELIELFYSKGLPVFIWDQDVWAEQLPDNVKHKVILLRPYFRKVPSFPYQELFLYGWSNLYTEKINELRNKKPLFDVSYCGNVYGRRNEFLEYFKPFHSSGARVCIQGNWLRKKYDDRDFALDNFPNFMFFGSTPHWSTLPTIAMSRSVIQFSNEAQQNAGLPTARIFETLMGGSVVFCSNKIKYIDKILPEELIFNSATDLCNKWNRADMPTLIKFGPPEKFYGNKWNEMRFKFEQKLKTQEHSYETRVKQLLEFVNKYYAQ